MRHVPGYLFAWICFVLLQEHAAAQSSQDYIVTNISQEQGIPQNNVTKIIRDQRGFLWITTLDGLARYDGNNVKTFDHKNLSPMKSFFFVDMQRGHDTSIWALSAMELICIRNDRLTARYPLPEAVESDSYFLLMPKTNNGILLLNRKVYYFISGQLIPATSLIDREFMSVAAVDNENFYFTTRDYRVAHYFRPGNRLRLIGNSYSNYFHTIGDKIYFWDGKKLMEVISSENAMPRQVYELPEIPWMIRTSGEGVAYMIHGELAFTSDLQSFRKIPLPEKNIANARNLLIDGPDACWIGSSNNGLFHCRNQRIRNYDPEGASPMHEIYFCRLIDSAIYTGACHGLFEYNLRDKTYTRSTRLLDGYCIWDAERYDSTTMAYGIFGEGLVLINEGKITSYVHPTLPSNNVFCLYKNKKGHLWIATPLGIMIMTSPGKFSPFRPGGLSINAFQFAEKKDGTMYIASSEGVLVVDAGYKLLQRHNSGTAFRSLYLDAEERLWIGADKQGLSLLLDDSLFSFPYGEGALNEDVLGITEDPDGNLWMSSNNGLYSVPKKTLLEYAAGTTALYAVRKYSTRHGLRNPEFNSHTQSKAMRLPDGSLWFAGVNGLVSVSPEKYDEDRKPGKLFIDAVLGDGKKIHVENGIASIPVSSDRITLVYMVPEFEAPENVFFEYRIGSGKWIFNNNSREISMAGMREGRHLISIRKYNDPSSEISLALHITAPFFYSNAFRILLLLLVMALLVLIFVYIERKMNARKIRKINRDNEMLSLKIMSLQKQINPHFIFNSLNSLQILFYEKKFREGNAYLTEFSSLLRSSLEYSRSDSTTLENELRLVKSYLELEQLQFDPGTFVYTINIAPGISTSKKYIPSFLLQPFVENAIKHGVRKSAENLRELVISVNRYEEGIVVTITDNGPGLPSGTGTQTAGNGNRHVSRGLEIIRNKISYFNRMYHQNIRLTIRNRKNATGTEVEILIPVTASGNEPLT